MLSLQKFTALTRVVIDNFEGGYYHPNMLKNFKPSDQAKLRFSGETMFGLDRKAGAQLAKYPEWAAFWKAADEGKKLEPSAWKYNAKNVPNAGALKEMAGAIMFKWFNELARKYILVGSMDEIVNDDRLIIHFSYASWNGEGWFKRYAEALNKAIAKFSGDKEAIFQEAIKARTMAVNKFGLPNKVIRQQGANMMALFKRLSLIK